MRYIESQWLRDRLDPIPSTDLSPALEIGSSGLTFRTTIKPHIEEHVHAPLRRRGIKVVTADIRDEDGVDIVGDVFDAGVQDRLKRVGAKTLLLCNLFEHLDDPQSFASVCRQFVEPGGWIIVTVPHDYPYHLDPIDTMFRPSPANLHEMFPGTELEVADVLVDTGYWSDLRRSMSVGGAVSRILTDLARTIALRGGVERARSRLSRLKYLFRDYKIAAVILKVPANTAASQ